MVLGHLDDFYIGTLRLTQPWQRFAGSFLISSAVFWVTQPSSMFDNGVPKSFSLMGDGTNVTAVPWWIPGTILGALSAVFI